MSLIVNPPRFSVLITGPLADTAYAYVTVTAHVANGVSPYSYAWTVNGNPNACGNENTCTAELGGPNFSLAFRVLATDADEHEDSALRTVYTCPLESDKPC